MSTIPLFMLRVKRVDQNGESSHYQCVARSLEARCNFRFKGKEVLHGRVGTPDPGLRE
jgi:hypothetical protein